MVSVVPLNALTAGIDTYTLATFTMLLVIRPQRYMWSLDKGGCSSNNKQSQMSFWRWWQNIHYLSTNLQNHITTKTFHMFRIITSKQQKFSQPDPVLIRQFSKTLHSDAVLIRPKLASVLIQSDPVLIRVHLWEVAMDPDQAKFLTSKKFMTCWLSVISLLRIKKLNLEFTFFMCVV